MDCHNAIAAVSGDYIGAQAWMCDKKVLTFPSPGLHIFVDG